MEFFWLSCSAYFSWWSDALSYSNEAEVVVFVARPQRYIYVGTANQVVPMRKN